MSSPTMYLSRARLRRDVPAAALRKLLLPDGDSARTAAGHRLVWTLFGDSPERTRDFLWREVDGGLYYLLSERRPTDRHGLFDLDPPKPFDPVLERGQRLRFMLRVNATVARGGGQGQRGKPSDIVMDALYRVPAEARAEERRKILAPVSHDWLIRQGAKHGFALEQLSTFDVEDYSAAALRVVGYHTLKMPRGRGASPLRAGVLDLEGELEVRDSAALLTAVAAGFGRCKAYGCGLMLLRRA